MKYYLLTIVFLLATLTSCHSTMIDEINKVRNKREEIVIQVTKEYFIAAGGKLEEFPNLFDVNSDWKQRTKQARLVLHSLSKDKDVSPGSLHKMTMYLALMLSEASIKE